MAARVLFAGAYRSADVVEALLVEARTYHRDKDGKFGSGDGTADEPNWATAARDDDAMAATPVAKGLTADAAGALAKYGRQTFYPDDYQVPIHQHVTSGLRNGKGDMTAMAARDREVVDGIDSAMSQVGALKEPIIVHRWVAPASQVFGSAADGDMTGVSWRDHSFVSTSSGDRAEDFARYGGPPDRVAMRVLVPAGTKALSSPDLDDGALDSDEILLDRGLKFTVVSDDGMVGGVRELTVRVS